MYGFPFSFFPSFLHVCMFGQSVILRTNLWDLALEGERRKGGLALQCHQMLLYFTRKYEVEFVCNLGIC